MVVTGRDTTEDKSDTVFHLMQHNRKNVVHWIKIILISISKKIKPVYNKN